MRLARVLSFCSHGLLYGVLFYFYELIVFVSILPHRWACLWNQIYVRHRSLFFSGRRRVVVKHTDSDNHFTECLGSLCCSFLAPSESEAVAMGIVTII